MISLLDKCDSLAAWEEKNKAVTLYFSDYRTRPLVVWLHGFVSLTINRRVLFMNKEEIYRDVMDSVISVTGFSEREIILSRSEECTDARYLLVRYLLKLLPPVAVGKLIGRTRQGVSSIMQRHKGDTWMIESNWKAIVKQLESKYSVSK